MSIQHALQNETPRLIYFLVDSIPLMNKNRFTVSITIGIAVVLLLMIGTGTNAIFLILDTLRQQH
jgi:hypothetical protein